MKPESLVIAGQPHRGEYVLKPCTHNKSAQQRAYLSGLNPLSLIKSSRKIAEHREVFGGGSGCKKQPRAKKDGLTQYRHRAVSLGKIPRKSFSDAWNRNARDLWRSDCCYPLQNEI